MADSFCPLVRAGDFKCSPRSEGPGRFFAPKMGARLPRARPSPQGAAAAPKRSAHFSCRDGRFLITLGNRERKTWNRLRGGCFLVFSPSASRASLRERSVFIWCRNHFGKRGRSNMAGAEASQGPPLPAPKARHGPRNQVAGGGAGHFCPGPPRPEGDLFESPGFSVADEIFLPSARSRGRAAAAVEGARPPPLRRKWRRIHSHHSWWKERHA